MRIDRICGALVALACCACGAAPARASLMDVGPAPRIVVVGSVGEPQTHSRPHPPSERRSYPEPRVWPASMLMGSRDEFPTLVSNPEAARGALHLWALNGSVPEFEPSAHPWAGLRIELGAGQAPHDDAPPSNALLPAGVRGFSDSLMRLVVEGQVSTGVTFEGGLAATRFQDEPILDGLLDAELAWISIGLRFRF
jgi:hypothetical protein